MGPPRGGRDLTFRRIKGWTRCACDRRPYKESLLELPSPGSVILCQDIESYQSSIRGSGKNEAQRNVSLSLCQADAGQWPDSWPPLVDVRLVPWAVFNPSALQLGLYIFGNSALDAHCIHPPHVSGCSEVRALYHGTNGVARATYMSAATVQPSSFQGQSAR